MPYLKSVIKMLFGSSPSRRNDWNCDNTVHSHQQVDIIAHLGSIVVHAGQKNLTGPQRGCALRPLHNTKTRMFSASIGIHIPPVAGSALGINRNDDALLTEP